MADGSSSDYRVSFSLQAERHLSGVQAADAKKVLALADRLATHPTAGAARLWHTKSLFEKYKEGARKSMREIRWR